MIIAVTQILDIIHHLRLKKPHNPWIGTETISSNGSMGAGSLLLPLHLQDKRQMQQCPKFQSQLCMFTVLGWNNFLFIIAVSSSLYAMNPVTEALAEALTLPVECNFCIFL
jgi:hypothetical protein